MQSIGSNWYQTIWSLDIKTQPWVENTTNQVDFIIKALGLQGGERILDLACGFGRHSLELSRRGYKVVGVDITKDYIEDAKMEAKRNSLSAEFFHSDIRDIPFKNEFDVVLNLADGAIGYLESDSENLKIFDAVAKALKSGGKHLMDVVNADYADTHFPCQLWDAGEKGLTLSKFEWDKEARIMMYGQLDILYNSPLSKPVFEKGCPTRLYNLQELESIMSKRRMHVLHTYSDYYGASVSSNSIQLMVVSEKNK